MKQNEMNSQKAQKLTTGPASSSGEQEAVSLTL